MKLKVLKNGPYILEGVQTAYGTDGEPISIKEKLVLCRCGHSASKPFCDGSHKKFDFSPDGDE